MYSYRYISYVQYHMNINNYMSGYVCMRTYQTKPVCIHMNMRIPVYHHNHTAAPQSFLSVPGNPFTQHPSIDSQMLRRKVVLEDRVSEQGTSKCEEHKVLHDNSDEGESKKQRTKRDVFAVLRGIALCGGGCIFCCFVVIIIIVVFVNEGHHVTCRFHGALCTPFREYVNRFPMLPSRSTNDRPSISPPVSQSCKIFEDFLTRHHQDSKRILLLMGESRGGSTYTYDTLNLHPEIEMIGQEALFSFSNNVCNNNAILRDHENCSFENWLDALYRNAYDRARSLKHLVGTKINIEQIPPEFYQDLAGYLACIRESAIILQVTRASAIASFFNYQAEPLERIHDGNFKFDSNSLAKSLETPLELDPEIAAEWVHTRDSLSHDLFRTLGFMAPLPLRYQRVYYEHLKDPVFGDDYWRSVFAFLGVDARIPASKLRGNPPKHNLGNLRTNSKTHGSAPCSQRIANWKEVKEALGQDSLSSSVCETHS